jgi:hypothetical protein
MPRKWKNTIRLGQLRRLGKPESLSEHPVTYKSLKFGSKGDMFETGEKDSADFTEMQNGSSGPIYSKKFERENFIFQKLSHWSGEYFKCVIYRCFQWLRLQRW